MHNIGFHGDGKKPPRVKPGVGRSRYAAEKNLITVYTSLDCPIPGVINQKEVYHEKI